MELDELKILFKENYNSTQAIKSTAEISLLLNRKTQSVISKIKRSLLIELIACIVFTLACAIIAMLTNLDYMRIYFLIFGAVWLLFLPVLWFLLQKTNRLSRFSLPVKSNLESIVKILKEYITRYFQLTMALIPITLAVVLMLGYDDKSINLDNPFYLNFSTKQVIFIIAYIVLFSVGMYYFTKWYLKKLYGNYIHQLEQLIKELEEE